ncbi:MAG: hypothetical protein ACYCR7_03430 [Thermoplasmataceae archaeon]
MKAGKVRTNILEQKVKLFKSYYKSKGYKCIYRLVDSNQSNRVEISPYVNNVNFPLDVILSLKKISGNSKTFGRIRADKRANLMIERKKHGLNPSLRTVAEEQYASELYDINADDSLLIYDTNFMIRQVSRNPVKLSEYSYRVRNAIELMGGILSNNRRVRKRELSKINSLDLSGGGKYIMDSRKIVHLIPWFTDPEPDLSGALIGLDSYSGKPIFLNIWNKPSYNCIVLGEIGSGKSYFSKAILLRNIVLGLVDEIYIFDPMNEYFRETELRLHSDLDIIRFCADSKFIESHIECGSKTSISTRLYRFDEAAKSEENFLTSIEDIFSRIKTSPNNRKIIILDEAHLLIRGKKTMAVYVELIRSSRHYNSSVFSITQGLSEFLSSQKGNSIIENSINVFIFRNKFWTDLKAMNFDPQDFGYSDFKNLSGGKGEFFSEFFYFSGGKMRKMAFISTTYEKGFIG